MKNRTKKVYRRYLRLTKRNFKGGSNTKLKESGKAINTKKAEKKSKSIFGNAEYERLNKMIPKMIFDGPLEEGIVEQELSKIGKSKGIKKTIGKTLKKTGKSLKLNFI